MLSTQNILRFIFNIKFVEVAFPNATSTWWAPYVIGLILRLAELCCTFHQQIFDYLVGEANHQSSEYKHSFGLKIISLLKMCFIAWLKKVAENELEKRIQQIRDDVAEVRIDIVDIREDAADALGNIKSNETKINMNENKINAIEYYIAPDPYQDMINRYDPSKEKCL